MGEAPRRKGDGTVGSDAKAELTARHGCEFPIVYTRQDFVAEVARVTDGAKVHVVYDSVGKDTVMQSLDCIRPMGMLVSFGVASGDTPPLDLRLLMSKGSLFATRPSFAHYMGDPTVYRAAALDLFALLASRVLTVVSPRRFPLREAAAAHRAVEGRQTSGASLLIP
jgi:NADPH2:quinone reductase